MGLQQTREQVNSNEINLHKLRKKVVNASWNQNDAQRSHGGTKIKVTPWFRLGKGPPPHFL
jgi:hypothetical protein